MTTRRAHKVFPKAIENGQEIRVPYKSGDEYRPVLWSIPSSDPHWYEVTFLGKANVESMLVAANSKQVVR